MNGIVFSGTMGVDGNVTNCYAACFHLDTLLAFLGGFADDQPDLINSWA